MAHTVKAPGVEDARSCLEQARQTTERARFVWLKARESLEHAQNMRVSLHAQIEELSYRGPFRPEFTTTLLSGILSAVIEGTGADMGNIQAHDRETESLRILVHRGFQEPFLKFFDSVDPGHAACGTALKSRARVIVPDIANSPIFSGTHLLEAMLDAGIRSVQSTPLIGKSAGIWGTLSTHYRTVTQPGKKDLHLIDYFAGWAAEILEAEHCAAHPEARSRIPYGNASNTPARVLPSPKD